VMPMGTTARPAGRVFGRLQPCGRERRPRWKKRGAVAQMVVRIRVAVPIRAKRKKKATAPNRA
jgi:hypothetical protein